MNDNENENKESIEFLDEIFDENGLLEDEHGLLSLNSIDFE